MLKPEEYNLEMRWLENERKHWRDECEKTRVRLDLAVKALQFYANPFIALKSGVFHEYESTIPGVVSENPSLTFDGIVPVMIEFELGHHAIQALKQIEGEK